MPLKKPTLWLALLAAFAMPLIAAPATLAQSAGDEQYVDPFQGGGGNGGGGGGGGDTGGDDGGGGDVQAAPEAAPAPVEPGVTTGAVPTDESTTGSTAGTTSDGPVLPVTGLAALPLILIGVLLLSGGWTLRRRV